MIESQYQNPALQLYAKAITILPILKYSALERVFVSDSERTTEGASGQLSWADCETLRLRDPVYRLL